MVQAALGDLRQYAHDRHHGGPRTPQVVWCPLAAWQAKGLAVLGAATHGPLLGVSLAVTNLLGNRLGADGTIGPMVRIDPRQVSGLRVDTLKLGNGEVRQKDRVGALVLGVGEEPGPILEVNVLPACFQQLADAAARG